MKLLVIFFSFFIASFTYSQEIINSYVSLNGNITEITRANAAIKTDVICLNEELDLWIPTSISKRTLKTEVFDVEKVQSVEDPITKTEFLFYSNEKKNQLVLGLIDSTVLKLNQPGSLELEVYINQINYKLIGFTLYALNNKVNKVEIRSLQGNDYEENPLKKMHIVFDKLNMRKGQKLVISNLIFQNPYTNEINMLRGDFLIFLQ